MPDRVESPTAPDLGCVCKMQGWAASTVQVARYLHFCRDAATLLRTLATRTLPPRCTRQLIEEPWSGLSPFCQHTAVCSSHGIIVS
jgi:hypothetical protein